MVDVTYIAKSTGRFVDCPYVLRSFATPTITHTLRTRSLHS